MSDPQTPRTFDVLVTASEAYPRLEHEFLSAQSDIVAGFRVFDPWTKLRSDTGLGVGDDWFDLITHTLNRGVSIKLYLTDFDPVVRMGMHLYAWRCLRGLIAAGEASDHPENLDVQVKMHPARVGLIPRIALWLRSFKEIGDQIDRITADQGISSTEIIKTAPRVRNLTVWKGDRLQARKFPPPPLVPVTHHQKLAVFDNTRLYVGGLDLNDRRFDTPDHEQPSEETWHDMQVIVSGQAAAEARLHLLGMDDWFTGSLSKRPQKILRTISTRRAFSLPFMSPRSAINEIENSHRDAIGRSEELIYFESQFFRDEALARCLAKRAARTPGLSMVMMLPAAPEEIAFQDSWGPDAKFGEHLQVKCIDILRDAFGDRVFIGAPAQPRFRRSQGRDTHFDAPIIYLHAKVSLFDDKVGIVSSANLNGRSLRWDTEIGVQTETPREVEELKHRCFEHWLSGGAGAEFYNTKSACDAWAGRAALNAGVPPKEREGFVLPYKSGPSRKDAQPLPGVPAEMA